MSTNYYAHTGDEVLHIGKSSAGWAFALRIYGADGPDNIEEWTLAIDRADKIVDEYGNEIDAGLMLKRIQYKPARAVENTPPPPYTSWASFYRENECYADHHTGLFHSVPNMRTGRYVNRGPGTFDYCRYEFS